MPSLPEGSWKKCHTQGTLPGAAQGPEARGRLQAGWFTIAFQNAKGIIFTNHVIKFGIPWVVHGTPGKIGTDIVLPMEFWI